MTTLFDQPRTRRTDPDTSRQAERRAWPASERICGAILALMADHAPRIDEEIADGVRQFGVTAKPQAIRWCRKQLVEDGALESVGTRKNQDGNKCTIYQKPKNCSDSGHGGSNHAVSHEAPRSENHDRR